MIAFLIAMAATFPSDVLRDRQPGGVSNPGRRSRTRTALQPSIP